MRLYISVSGNQTPSNSPFLLTATKKDPLSERVYIDKEQAEMLNLLKDYLGPGIGKPAMRNGVESTYSLSSQVRISPIELSSVKGQQFLYLPESPVLHSDDVRHIQKTFSIDQKNELVNGIMPHISSDVISDFIRSSAMTPYRNDIQLRALHAESISVKPNLGSHWEKFISTLKTQKEENEVVDALIGSMSSKIPAVLLLSNENLPTSVIKDRITQFVRPHLRIAPDVSGSQSSIKAASESLIQYVQSKPGKHELSEAFIKEDLNKFGVKLSDSSIEKLLDVIKRLDEGGVGNAISEKERLNVELYLADLAGANGSLQNNKNEIAHRPTEKNKPSAPSPFKKHQR